MTGVVVHPGILPARPPGSPRDRERLALLVALVALVVALLGEPQLQRAVRVAVLGMRAEVVAQTEVVEELLGLELVRVHVESGPCAEHALVEGLEVLDRERDVHHRARGEPGNGRRHDVLDPAELGAERGADLVGLGGEARGPRVVVLDDVDAHSGVT